MISKIVNEKIQKMFLFIALYLYLSWNYANSYICLSRNSYLWVSIFYWILSYFLCGSLEIKKSKYLDYIRNIIYFLIPLISFYILESMWNISAFQISITKVFMNYVILLCIQIGVLLLSRNYYVSGCITFYIGYIWGIVNYYLMLFKGNPLTPSEITAVGTAMDVIGNYVFSINDTIVVITLLLMLYIYIWRCVSCGQYYKKEEKPSVRIIYGTVWMGIVFFILTSVSWKSVCNITLDYYVVKNNYYNNGSIFGFVLEGQSLKVEEPKGYSVKAAKALLEEREVHDNVVMDDVKPSVIVIMNESFADLSVLGEIESEEYLTNFYGIDDYIIRGNTYVSVIGGGTCNSEFEFLTGCSMGNLPLNIYPYQMYDLNGVYSLPEMFTLRGYETVAIHPGAEKAWRRDYIYKQLGFDDYISAEDMKDAKKLRNYTSDSYNYEKLIETYESLEEPGFIFNITIQNHGGYSDIENLTDVSIVEVEEAFKKTPEMATYLTLMRESDNALKRIFEYFSQEEKPIIICLFGDHLPGFLSSTYGKEFAVNNTALASRQRWYSTPYIIWSNFEVSEKKQIMDTSLNYLGAAVLELAGIQTPYTQFLLDMKEDIPAMNFAGFQTTDGQWHEYTEENEWINKYRILQHYVMFDKKE